MSSHEHLTNTSSTLTNKLHACVSPTTVRKIMDGSLAPACRTEFTTSEYRPQTHIQSIYCLDPDPGVLLLGYHIFCAEH